MRRIGKPIRFASSTFKDRGHICAFFNSTKEARRVLLSFISEGLEVGDKALHTIDPEEREEHLRWLTSSGIDVVAARNKEQLEILDWTDSHLRRGPFASAVFASGENSAQITTVGEPPVSPLNIANRRSEPMDSNQFHELLRHWEAIYVPSHALAGV